MALDPLAASKKVRDTQPTLYVFEGMVARGLADYPEALRLFQKAASIRRTPWTMNHLGYTYAKLGRRDEALRIIAELGQAPVGRPE